MFIKLTSIDNKSMFVNVDQLIQFYGGQYKYTYGPNKDKVIDATILMYLPFHENYDYALETPEEIEAKLAEKGDKITLGPITMTAPEWLAEMYRKFDQVDMLVNNNYRELLSKIAEQAPAPVIGDSSGMLDTNDRITTGNDIAPVESHPCDTKPVESHQPAGDEAKWPTVDVFAGIMKERLEANKDKGGWKDCTAGYLTKRLDEEARELTHAIVGGNVENIRCEAADVANFAMMIADNAEAIVARQGGTV